MTLKELLKDQEFYINEDGKMVTEIELKKLNLLISELEKYAEKETKATPKKKYGEYNHVRLTDKEFDSIMECYGSELGIDLIRYLDEYIEMKGYKAKNHYLCIKKWVVEAVKNDKNKRNNQNVKGASMPDWFDKDIKSDKATDEDLEEMEEILKEIAC